MNLRTIIDGISTLIGLVIVWLLLGAVLSVFIGPGGFGLSAMFIAIFWLVPDNMPSCSCQEGLHEREYTDQELGEGLHLSDRHRFERQEPVAAMPAVTPSRHDHFDASSHQAQADAWAQAVRHHVPVISLTATPARATPRRRTVRNG
jgi:hypothetical protein